MLPTILVTLALILTPLTTQVTGDFKLPINPPLASHSMSMTERYGNTFVNDVFKDNILLTLKYLDGKVKAKTDINWSDIEKPFSLEFTLRPGEEFAFHDKVLPEFKDKIDITTHAHFNYTDGFKSDGFLTGDGVCHLASLIYWVAKDAGLEAIAPRNHDFATIPGVPKEYGVAIYAHPDNPAGSAYQNLYIKNTKEKPVKFVFDYDGINLKLSILEIS